MTVALSDLRSYVTDALVAAGAAVDDAAKVVDVMLWAEARGRSPQGVIWADVLAARLLAGTLVSPAPMSVDESRFPTRASVDAARGFGQVAGRVAVDRAAVTAERYGVAVVTIRNSNHYGPSGYYAWELAERGLVGLSATNALPKVAAPGGTVATLGTNPLAFAVPVAGRPPLVGDLSTGALAGSRVREAIAHGTQLPDGQLLDRTGRPTTDPNAMADGGVMLPMAGGKGFALGLLVESLTSVLGAGALAGSVSSMFDPRATPNTSHVVIAIHPDDDGFAARARALADEVLAGGDQVRLPGWSAADRAELVDRDGLALPDDTVASLRSLAARVDVDEPGWLGR